MEQASYQDRGMKKWQPFLSSQELRHASQHTDTHAVIQQVPVQQSESEIGERLYQAYHQGYRVKVTLNYLVEERHVYYTGQVAGLDAQHVVIATSPLTYETIRHVEILSNKHWWEA